MEKISLKRIFVLLDKIKVPILNQLRISDYKGDRE